MSFALCIALIILAISSPNVERASTGKVAASFAGWAVAIAAIGFALAVDAKGWP